MKKIKYNPKTAFGNKKLKDQVDTKDRILYNEVENFVIKTQDASVSNLQRKFKIGYAKSALLLELLEENDVVGPPNFGTMEPREVLIGQEDDY